MGLVYILRYKCTLCTGAVLSGQYQFRFQKVDTIKMILSQAEGRFSAIQVKLDSGVVHVNEDTVDLEEILSWQRSNVLMAL